MDRDSPLQDRRPQLADDLSPSRQQLQRRQHPRRRRRIGRSTLTILGGDRNTGAENPFAAMLLRSELRLQSQGSGAIGRMGDDIKSVCLKGVVATNVVLVDNEQTSSRLNPTQERTLGLLRRPSEPVVFNGDQISSFISDFSDAFDHLTARVTALDTTLFISKGAHLGARLRGALQEKEEFRWSVPTAIGTVAHRAIELLTAGGEPLIRQPRR